jgi:fibronectin type 3 domain-containing protein
MKALGAYSNEVTTTPANVPAVGTVTNLVATPGNNSVQLNWDAVAGANGYHIERKTGANAYAEINNTTVTNNFLDNAANTPAPAGGAPVNGTTYMYRVRAYINY